MAILAYDREGFTLKARRGGGPPAMGRVGGSWWEGGPSHVAAAGLRRQLDKQEMAAGQPPDCRQANPGAGWRGVRFRAQVLRTYEQDKRRQRPRACSAPFVPVLSLHWTAAAMYRSITAQTPDPRPRPNIVCDNHVRYGRERGAEGGGGIKGGGGSAGGRPVTSCRSIISIVSARPRPQRPLTGCTAATDRPLAVWVAAGWRRRREGVAGF